VATKIWSGPNNPTASVAHTLGIERWQLRNAIHAIKKDTRLGARDRVTIWDDGSVTSDIDGSWIGDIVTEIRGKA